MRKTILFAPALLGACSTAPAAPVVVHGETPGHTCVEGAADSYIGKARSDATGKADARDEQFLWVWREQRSTDLFRG